jgi:hypothetical protein
MSLPLTISVNRTVTGACVARHRLMIEPRRASPAARPRSPAPAPGSSGSFGESTARPAKDPGDGHRAPAPEAPHR